MLICPYCNSKIAKITDQTLYEKSSYRMKYAEHKPNDKDRGLDTKDFKVSEVLCHSCEKIFFVLAETDTHLTRIDGSSYSPRDGSTKYNIIYPFKIVSKNYDDENFKVGEISPSFYDAFNEAATAELRGLENIAGIGYRRALEYLVKDFHIYSLSKDKSLDEIEKIKETVGKDRASLGVFIEKHISDAGIAQPALSAVLLGNDYAHYTTRYADKDLSEIKSLIDVIVQHIKTLKARELLTKKYSK